MSSLQSSIFSSSTSRTVLAIFCHPGRVYPCESCKPPSYEAVKITFFQRRGVRTYGQDAGGIRALRHGGQFNTLRAF